MTPEPAIGAEPLGVVPKVRMQVECLDGFDDPFGEIGRSVPNVTTDELSEMQLQILRLEPR
jgi:hypothetical protein